MGHQTTIQGTNLGLVPRPSVIGLDRASPAPGLPAVLDRRSTGSRLDGGNDNHFLAKDCGIGLLARDTMSRPGSGSSLMRYSANQALFNQFEAGQFVHVVAEGAVRLQRTLCDGRRLVGRFALPGDAIGLWTERDARFSAEALGSVTTRRIPRAALLAILDSMPGLRDRLRKDAGRELALTDERLMMLARYRAREKVAAFLIQMRDRWFALNGQCVRVALPMSRQDIGDFLGVTLETVSRMISAFARERLLVVVPDGVRLLDVARLRAIGLALNGG